MQDVPVRRRARNGVLVACVIALAAVVVPQAASATPTATPVVALSFDEGQGDRAADTSPAGNHGVLTGARWVTTGRFGGALSFDGDDRVTVADAASLDSSRLTVEAWVRPSRDHGWQTVLSKRENAVDDRQSFALFSASDGYTTQPRVVAGEWGPHGPRPLPVDQWSHLAATFDGTTWRLYVDGVFVSDRDGAALVASALPLTIGANDPYTNEGFEGLIDEVRIYDRALTEEELRRDRDTRIGQSTFTTPRPVMAMGFEDGTGTTATDSSLIGNPGQVEGAQWTPDGKFGRALLFDGAGDRVSVADSPSLDLSSAMSIEAWVKPRQMSEFATVVIKESPKFHSYALYASGYQEIGTTMFQPPEGSLAKAGFTDRWRVRAPTTTPRYVRPGVWTHLAFTYDGTNARLYVDGALVTTLAATPPPVTDNVLRIGGNTQWNNEFFNGIIDEVRVYNVVLTPQEVLIDRDTPVRRSQLARPDEAEPRPAAAALAEERQPAPAEPVGALAASVPEVASAALARTTAKPNVKRRSAPKRKSARVKRTCARSRTAARKAKAKGCVKPRPRTTRRARQRARSTASHREARTRARNGRSR